MVHMRTVHEGVRDFQCSKCAMEFGCQNNLTSHIKIVHESKKGFQCSKCSKQFGHKRHLNYHMKYIHDVKSVFKCKVCLKEQRSKNDLETHLNTVHAGRKEIFQCHFIKNWIVSGKLWAKTFDAIFVIIQRLKIVILMLT